MTRKFTIAGLSVIVAALAGIGALFAISGTSSANDEPTPVGGSTSRDADAAGDALLAVAIGQLEEDDGESATVDLRANNRTPGGNFRFYSEEYGYYNGGVRRFNCDDGEITAVGGGVLVQPDGTRVVITYEANFDTDGGSASVTVKGRGVNYTLEGELDGLAWCGDPSVAPPTATT